MLKNILSAFCAACALAASADVVDPHGVVVDHGTLYGPGVIPSCHATTVVELPGGDVLAAYFAGTYEGHPDVCVYMSRRRAGHTTWDLPQLLVSGIRTEWTESAFTYDEPAVDANPDDVSDFVKNTRKRKACYNPVLYHAPGGDLVLDYKLGAFVQDWTGWEVRSTDGGYTWTHPRALQTDRALHQVQLGPIKNKPVLVDCPTAEGGQRIVAGSSTETGGDWKFHFELSDDGGHSWRIVYPEKDTLQCIQPSILTLPAPRARLEETLAPARTGGADDSVAKRNSTSVVTTPPDRGAGGVVLKAIGRTRHGRLAQSFSHDGGETWSEVTLSDMPNNNRGIDALTLRDGRHVLVYNDSNVEGRRTPLSVAISDDGEHWTKLLDLETDDLGEYSYPSVIQASDGRLWVLYTWRRLLPAYAIIDIEKVKP